MAVELEWVLAYATRPDWRADHPTIGAVYESRPGLEAAVSELWDSDQSMSCGGFLELVVLAHQAGLLFGTDGDALVAGLEDACTSVSSDASRLPLRSETAADGRAVLARLALLRRSKRRRLQYVEVVGAAWEAARQDWERHGLPSVERAIACRRRAAERGAGWQELADTACFSDHLAATVAGMGTPASVAVVPAFYTHKGLFVDLPGVVVVGVRTDLSGPEAWARTEALARQLKTISDPTRLAILDTLRRGPRTVTELASTFSLAQPTVSNHVKTLRQAGLVADVRQAGRRNLVVRTDELEEILGTLQDVLADPNPPQV